MSGLDFKTAKQTVLVCIYQNLHSMAGKDWLSLQDVRNLEGQRTGKPYLRKVLGSLEKEGLTEILQDENRGELFSISEEGILLVEQRILSSQEGSQSETSVPAADRIVDIHHNQPPVSQIIAELTGLEEGLAKGNEAGQIFGDDRPAVLAEVGALRSMLTKARARADTILSFAKRTLSWIIEKAAGATIGEAAKLIFKHIVAWLS